MKTLSSVLRAAKLRLSSDEPFIILLEIEKTGWFQVWYDNVSVAFSEGYDCHDTNGTDAEILFNIQDPGHPLGDGYLVVQNVTTPYQFVDNHVLTDDGPGSALVNGTIDCSTADPIRFRFARNTERILYDGNYYEPMPFEMNPAKMGAEITPSLQIGVSNVLRMVESFVRKGSGFKKEAVSLKIVWNGDLTQDPIWEHTFEVRSVRADRDQVSMTVGMENPLYGSFPGIYWSRKRCAWRYKKGGCPITGATYSDCPRDLRSCQDRHYQESTPKAVLGMLAGPAIPGSFFDAPRDEVL